MLPAHATAVRWKQPTLPCPTHPSLPDQSPRMALASRRMASRRPTTPSTSFRAASSAGCRASTSLRASVFQRQNHTCRVLHSESQGSI